MSDFDKEILSQNWMPTPETLDLLKLNNLSKEHIDNCLAYLKQQYPNTHISEVPSYDTWSSLFVMFCIKANKQMNSKEPPKD